MLEKGFRDAREALNYHAEKAADSGNTLQQQIIIAQQIILTKAQQETKKLLKEFGVPDILPISQLEGMYKPFTVIGLTTRVEKPLLKHAVKRDKVTGKVSLYTVMDLDSATDKELLRFSKFGAKSLKEVRDKIREYKAILGL